MEKDLVDLEITLEDEDYEALKERADKIGTDVQTYLIGDFVSAYLKKATKKDFDTQANTLDNRVSKALLEAYEKANTQSAPKKGKPGLKEKKTGFKVVPFKNANYETRYRIVSTDTEKILDDAQGYGYKTIQKAYAGYGYKTRDKSKDSEREAKVREIKTWMKEHKSFVECMNQFAFEIAKGSWGPDDKFDAKIVKQMLKDNNLEPNFTASELLKVWRS